MVVVVLLVGATPPVDAQTNTTTTTRVASLPLSPQATAADTGRMTWGHQDFSGYHTPDVCDRAVVDANQALLARTHALDTLPWTPATDTMATAAVRIAQVCGGRFEMDKVDGLQLPSLLRLALVTHDDAHAMQVVDRQLALAHTPSEQARILLTAIETLLGTAPPRVALARSLLARLDALGPPALAPRIDARDALIRYSTAVYDTAQMRQSAIAAIALAQQLTRPGRDAADVFTPYRTLFVLANDAADMAQAKAVIAQARREIGGWRGGQADYVLDQMENLIEDVSDVLGVKTHALSGTYWFNAQGREHPAPGTLSLLFHVEHNCGERCRALYAVIRQLHERYGAALDITLMTQTVGYAPGSGPLTPEAEAKAAAAYFLDFLHLPVAVLVDSVPRTTRPDGHIVYGSTPNSTMFDSWQQANTVLVDQQGAIRWVGKVDKESAPQIASQIDRVQKRSPSVPPPTTTSRHS